MTEACEQRIETPFAVYDQKFNQKIDEMRIQIRTLEAEQKKIVEEGREMDYEIRQLKKKVIFSARKISSSSFDVDFDGPIAYDTIDVNIGGGMQSNGKFIAPESGTYGFTFSAATGSEKSETLVRVYKDDNFHHDIYDGNEADIYNNINGSWMMKLAKGQVVHLEVGFGKLQAYSQLPVIFTGNLLMLDE